MTMGDRGQVYVHEGRKRGVYLYTHWRGTELPEDVKKAMARGRSRWDDTPYLTRIIFSQMIMGSVGDADGYGIDAHDMGPDHDTIKVDTVSQTVTYEGKTYTFEEWITS
jgi:hypothetical protein